MASATKENSSTENDVLETKQKVQNRAEEKKVKWGEEEFEDEEEVEREPEESDIKTVVEYQNGPEGRIKIIKKVRVYKRQKRVNKKVMERRARWKKFGLVAGKPPGPEPGITILGDEINFVLGQTQDEKKFEDKVKRENYESDIVCHICGKVGHWTKECPYRDQNMNVSLSAGELMQRPGEGGAAKKSDRYVPPAHRRGVSALVDDDYENVPRLRVSNLSEDTTDRDLGELFRPFGPITKIFLPRDKKTGKSKVPPSLDFFSHSLCRFSLVFFWQCSEVFSHSLLVAGICIHHILTQRRCCASDGGPARLRTQSLDSFH
jgi:translation initiation factor 3 subunit G